MTTEKAKLEISEKDEGKGKSKRFLLWEIILASEKGKERKIEKEKQKDTKEIRKKKSKQMEEGKEIILSMKNGKEDLEKCEDESEKKEGTKM